MAEEKPKPAPKLYNKLNDKKIDDILADYQKLFHPDSEHEFKKERGIARRSIKNHIYMHLSQHGVDEKTKDLKQYSYNHLKGADRRNWVEDFLHSIALAGIGLHQNKDAVTAYASNPNMLREYINQNMVTDNLKDYESIIEALTKSKDLINDFDEDGALKEFMDSYIMGINSKHKKMNDYHLHLSRTDFAPDITKYTSKIADKHGVQIAAHAPVGLYLDVLRATANPDTKLKPDDKYVLKKPEEKKK